MSRVNPKVKLFCLVGVLLFCSLTLFASSEGEQHGFNWWRFLGQILNSTILFGGLIYLLRKPISSFLYKQTVDVKEDIVQREKNLEDTRKSLAEIKSRLDKIEAEVTQMKEMAEKSGAEEQGKLEALGQQEVERIRHLNEMEIANKVDASIRKLKEKIADLTVAHFKQDIGAELDDRLHEKIIERNIEISGDIIERE